MHSSPAAAAAARSADDKKAGKDLSGFSVHGSHLTSSEIWHNRLLLILGVICLLGVIVVGSKSALDRVNHATEDEVVPVDSYIGYPSFWGNVTATIDWCEPNYYVSPYIAEFFNTISNIGFIASGFFGIYIHPHLEFRYIVAYGSMIIVGLGSAAFHTTLKWHAQLGDEVCSSSFFLSFLSFFFFFLHLLTDVIVSPLFLSQLPISSGSDVVRHLVLFVYYH
jgi:hypothetical protein